MRMLNLGSVEEGANESRVSALGASYSWMLVLECKSIGKHQSMRWVQVGPSVFTWVFTDLHL